MTSYTNDLVKNNHQIVFNINMRFMEFFMSGYNFLPKLSAVIFVDLIK